MKKRALITGINGMDGSHLADLLLEKNYEVFGVERRSSTRNRVNTLHLVEKIEFLNEYTTINDLKKSYLGLKNKVKFKYQQYTIVK